MAEVQPLTSNAMLLKRWTDALQHWKRKCVQYESEAAQSTDADHRQELLQSIETCQNVIATCQGLVQALQGNQSDPSSTDFRPLATSGGTAQEPSPVLNPLPSTFAVGNGIKVNPSPAPPLSPADTGVAHKPASLPSWGKGLLAGFVSLTLLATLFWVGMRPRDICKTSQGGTFDSNALTRWVEDAIRANSPYAHYLRTVAIAQYGCVIVLKGRVPRDDIQQDFIRIAKTVKIPNQAPEAKLKQWLGLSKGETIQPVERVVSQIEVAPLKPWEQ